MKKISLKDLTPDQRNYNKGTEFGMSLINKSLRAHGAGRSVLLDKNNKLIAGNKTVENAADVGIDEVIVVETTGKQLVAVKRTDIDLDTEEGREMALADNATGAANLDWNQELLLADYSEKLLQAWGIDTNRFFDAASAYTRKVEVPIYEPKRDKPQLEELVNMEEFHKLKELIVNATIPENERAFLMMAASRFLAFRYDRIADYYAHSNKEIKELMERLALVIIDFGKAIEFGFFKLTQTITDQYIDENGD